MTAAQNRICFEPELIQRYDSRGPRYPSYPPADHFSDWFTEKHYREIATKGNESPIPRALSLYLHIPFCNTLCFFCACTKIVTRNSATVEKYLEHLCREIQIQGALYDDDREVVQLHLGGGTPTFLNTTQIERVLRQIERSFSLSKEPDREFAIEIDPRTVTPQSLEELQQLGFNRISLGVQDFNPKVQEAIHRIQSPEETLQLLQHAREIGFHSTNVDLIYGLPFQSVETFNRTLDLLMTAPPDRLSVFNYAHLPWRFPAQRRIHEKDLPSSQEKLRILETCIHWLTEAGYSYIGMDHFARPQDSLTRAQLDGTLGRNFQGYSTHADCDLVGVGVSAISQVENCYSQNLKELAPYHRAVEKGRLAVDRGYRLSGDDQIRRRVIDHLICFGRADLKAILAPSQLAPKTYFVSELAALNIMATDGLLSVDEESNIQVTPAGRFLIRNICRVFDRYAAVADSESKYSRVI